MIDAFLKTDRTPTHRFTTEPGCPRASEPLHAESACPMPVECPPRRFLPRGYRWSVCMHRYDTHGCPNSVESVVSILLHRCGVLGVRLARVRTPAPKARNDVKSQPRRPNNKTVYRQLRFARATDVRACQGVARRAAGVGGGERLGPPLDGHGGRLDRAAGLADAQKFRKLSAVSPCRDPWFRALTRRLSRLRRG